MEDHCPTSPLPTSLATCIAARPLAALWHMRAPPELPRNLPEPPRASQSIPEPPRASQEPPRSIPEPPRASQSLQELLGSLPEPPRSIPEPPMHIYGISMLRQASCMHFYDIFYVAAGILYAFLRYILCCGRYFVCIFTIYSMLRQAPSMHIYDIFAIKERDTYFLRIFAIYYATTIFRHFHDTLYENDASAMLRQAFVCIFTIYSTPRTSFY